MNDVIGSGEKLVLMDIYTVGTFENIINVVTTLPSPSLKSLKI